MMHLEVDRDEMLDGFRPIFEMASSLRATTEVLATRGNRLALTRFCVAGTEDPTGRGPSEVEFLQLLEVDDDGNRVAAVGFDPDDLDAAYAELDQRYFAAEAAPYAAALEMTQRYRRGLAARDWEALDALLAPDFVVEDHSPLGWGTLDRLAYLESVKALAALAPDSRVRTDHLWLCERGALGVHVVLGTHEGGAFEQPRVTISEVDAQGRERRRDVYTLDQLAAARARFEELWGSAP